MSVLLAVPFRIIEKATLSRVCTKKGCVGEEVYLCAAV